MRKKYIPVLITGSILATLVGCGTTNAYTESVQIESENVQHLGTERCAAEKASEKDIKQESGSDVESRSDENKDNAENSSVEESSTKGTSTEEADSEASNMTTSFESSAVPESEAYNEPAQEDYQQSEPEPNPEPEPVYVNELLQNYGSYENYAQCLYNEINKIRSSYGPQMINSWQTDDIAYRVNALGARVGKTCHWSVFDYPELNGLFRAAESCAFGNVESYVDVAAVANRLTLGHTKLIVTDPDNVYLAVSVIPYNKNGLEYLSITLDSWTGEEYNNYVIGKSSWKVGTNNGSITQTSIY